MASCQSWTSAPNRWPIDSDALRNSPRRSREYRSAWSCVRLVRSSRSPSQCPPKVLFEDYPYFSSVIPSLVAHAKEIADRVVLEQGLGAQSLAMEIASNDGYLLQHYRDAGVRVLGVDPARNIAAIAEERGIPTKCAFFGRELAEELVAEGNRPDVVHANNVLAHVPDVNGFVAGIATLIGSKECW